MLMASCRDAPSVDSPKIEGIEGNQSLGVGEIGQVLSLRQRGFNRV